MAKVNLGKKVSPIASIVVFLLAYGAVYSLTHKSGDVTQSSNYLTTDTSKRSYTSVKHGFSVNFPGNPTISNSSVDVQGVSVPYTTYERDNGNTYYQVGVFEYPPSFDMSDVDARLEGAINGSAQNVKGGSLVSSNFGQFAGHRSITEKISVRSGGQTIYVYETVFLKENTMFILQTSGAGESDFNSFASTFHLS